MEITVADDISAEYRGLVQSILDNPEFKKLQRYKQHFQTTRFMHSLNVSYISWLIARKLGWDAQTAARAGLLHDFCVYDFKDKLPKGEIQAYYHPRVAASTSEKAFPDFRQRATGDPVPHVSAWTSSRKPGGMVNQPCR